MWRRSRLTTNQKSTFIKPEVPWTPPANRWASYLQFPKQIFYWPKQNKSMKKKAFAQTVSGGWAIVQIFRIMRIIIILLTAINLQAGAYSYAQQITLNARNVPLYQVLEQI